MYPTGTLLLKLTYFMEILLRSSQKWEMAMELVAAEDSRELGNLHYVYLPEQNKYKFLTIYVTHQYKAFGVAYRLGREFVRRIGTGQAIFGLITNIETLQKLDEIGLLACSVDSSPLVVNDQRSLSKLPIVRLASRIGVTTDNLFIEYLPSPLVNSTNIRDILEEVRPFNYIQCFHVRLNAHT